MSSVIIQVLRCQDLAKVQRVGVQDPYVLVKYGESERQTRTHNNGGTDPVFNETFALPKEEGNTEVKFKILNERGRRHETIGKASLDFSAAVESGQLDTAVPVMGPDGEPQGVIEVSIRYPRARVQAIAREIAGATEEMKELSTEEPAPPPPPAVITPEMFEEALSAARAKFYADVATAMVPHNAVTGGMAGAFVDSVKQIREEAEEEFAKVFEKAKEKLVALAGDTIKEWAQLGQDFREEIVETIKTHDEAAKERFAPQLETLSAEMLENGKEAKDKFEGTIAGLVEGLAALQEKYKADTAEALEAYEGGFYKVLSHYKGSVEDNLKEEAETKAQEEAVKTVGGQPGDPLPAPPPPPEPAAPEPEAPPPADVPAPPPEAQYPYAPSPETIRAQQEAAYHQQQAYYAQQQALQAQQEAEIQRRRAAEAQAAMTAEIMDQRRRRAVRRGIVGGVIMAKVLF